jgi:predicted AAA+ superfamily ATPase
MPAFSQFLNAAALSDAELVNSSTIARDCGVSSHTVQGYFQILVDTLLGRWLPSYTKRPKRRVIQAPKFYFSDVGVVNYLAKRKGLEPGGALFGKALENWVHQELNAYAMYEERDAEFYYWRLASGVEVDFIVNDMQVALEVKASSTISGDHLKGLRSLKQDHPRLQTAAVVCLEAKPRRTQDAIWILPAREFARRLWAGELF